MLWAVLAAAACQTEAIDAPEPATSRAAAPLSEPDLPTATHFGGLEPAVLRLDDPRFGDAATLRRFVVSQDTARAWAEAWIAEHGELPGPAHVCLALPWRDAANATVAHLFVLTDLADCASWTDLLDEMRRIANDVERSTIASPASGSLEGAVLAARTRASARHFFTLAVSAWSFQHPLRDGIKGLPFWLIAFDRLPAGTSLDGLEPTAVFPVGDRDGLVEVVDYRSASRRLLLSHHRGAVVTPEALTWRFSPVEVLRAWRSVALARHSADPGGWVAAHERLWTRYLGGGRP